MRPALMLPLSKLQVLKHPALNLAVSVGFAMCVLSADAEPTAVSMGGSSTALMEQPESVYAPPAPPREDEGVNAGAVHFDLAIRYTTDYVYRGVDRGEFIAQLPDQLAPGQEIPGPLDPATESTTGAEDRPNYQVDSKLSFDLGKLPHPYIGVFVNIYNADPLSRFQEVRPSLGFEWTLKPFFIDVGGVSYILPEREYANTTEIYAKVTLDDRRLFKTERAVLSPYVFVDYDIDVYNGWYIEAGIKHDFRLEDWGLTLTAYANAAYVLNNNLYQEIEDGPDSGFQHYEVGLLASYSLNNAFNISKRYGEFAIEGYVVWTDQMDPDLRATSQIWGGAGIKFSY